eukprot:Hpha_TRINITY_DN34456_c0_g1::TRINITY_DN34456_c0_g1_i1::g.96184::m.96184
MRYARRSLSLSLRGCRWQSVPATVSEAEVIEHSDTIHSTPPAHVPPPSGPAFRPPLKLCRIDPAAPSTVRGEVIINAEQGVVAAHKALGRESAVALRMLLWMLAHRAVGASKDRVSGALSRHDRLWRMLDEHGVDLDYIKSSSPEERFELFDKIGVPSVERTWLAALTMNRPCGAVVLSADGKHVCLRQGIRAFGWRCGLPGHHRGTPTPSLWVFGSGGRERRRQHWRS